ncbi:RidA family protein [Streptomyces peucetius]|uniref:RidA family protein n=1 Tax=Streptomyces peucetius TaxID=1950 RepID=UPI00299F5BD9|nr:RidA family protein [Streptomyces peucetius]
MCHRKCRHHDVGPGTPSTSLESATATGTGTGTGNKASAPYRWVTDISVLPQARSARDACIDTTRPPANTAVQVAALVRPELLVEVEAFAVIPW